MMKTAFRCVQIVLLFYGVFGADEDEVKAVSVMEGDSVTLNPDLTQIKTFNLIEWRFRGPIIAQTDGNDISYPTHTEIFRGRLQLDQTGSLTIKNMKTKHSGLYELKIRHGAGTAERKFSVTVYESPSVIDAGKAEMTSVSVKEGDRVTLQTGVTQISGDELIVWRFGDEGKLIAKTDKEAKSSSLYDTDERFRDRLVLELDQTGSLIITDTRSTDSGFYSVKISSRTQTVYKRFSVSVSEPGLSSGAVAGIVLVFLAAVVAAAAAGFIYYRRKISELQKLPVPVTGTEGDDITLKPNKEIQKGDVIQWMFGEEETQTSIAKLIGETGEIVTHDYAADEIFRDILVLDKTTGSLIIRNSRTTHSGLYTLYITSSSGDSQQRFIVTVKERVEEISVDEDGSVTLKPDTEIQRDDQIQWIFAKHDVLIAEIRGGTGEICICDDVLGGRYKGETGEICIYDDVLGGRYKGETGEICIYDDVLGGKFRGRVTLEKTGSLTITNITAEHTGPYTLQIISSRGTLCKRFRVHNPLRYVFVTEGESVHLSTERPEIERDDEIQWRFGDEIIAEIKGGTGKTHDGAAGRFRDRLQLNDRTGDLTIKNSTDKDDGDYKLKISSRKGNTNRTYSVIITGRHVYVTEGESVHLSTDRPKIERDDEIQWRFGGEIIAEIKGGTRKIHDGADGRFRDRLQLNDQTGDLTIKSCTAEDDGDYKLKISSRKGNTNRAYSVTIRWSRVPVTEGESVRLSTDRPKIERDDVIQWRFGGEIIAEVKEGTGETHDGPDGRFRDRLQLNVQTGDLTIKRCTAEDEYTGYYNLKIRSSKGNTNRTYSVTIRDEAREESLMKGNNGRYVYVTEGESVHLSTDRPKIERGDEIQWMFGEEIIAEIKEGTGKTHDGADERFRDRLQLDDQTGDLTIKSCTAEDDGDYKLKIRSRKGNTDRTYSVIITYEVSRVSVTEGESVRLSTDRPEIERDDEIQWRFGGEIIAEIKGGTGKTHDGAAGRFRDRLQLNDQTGDLTIKRCTAEDDGRYKLKIRSSKRNTNRTYSVIITGRDVYVTAGDSVRLSTDRPKIERDAAVTDAVKPREKSPVKGNNGKRVDESAVEMQPLMIK